MLHSIRNNFGNAAFVFPLISFTGYMFDAPISEIVLASILMYIVCLVLLVMDNVFVMDDTQEQTFTEEELQEFDELVNANISNIAT